MSASVGTIDLGLDLNYRQFNGQLGSIAGNAQNMVGGAFKRLGGIIAGAFAVKGLVNFGKECMNLGSDMAEVQNVVDVTFGAMSEDINRFAKNALNQFGLSELSAKQYASTMGAMLKSSGLAGQATEMSKVLTGLAGDMASFYNLDASQAFDKIRAGISGETEPLKQLGVNMSVANLQAYALSQGIGKTYDKMSQAEQTLLRYNYLLSVTGDAQGDFARTSDSWANQTRILNENFRGLMGTLGQGLIAVLTPVVKWLNTIIQRLSVAANAFKSFCETLFGAKKPTDGIDSAFKSVAQNTGQTAGNVTEMGKQLDKVGKKAKGTLAGFDRLNTLSLSDGSGSSNLPDYAQAIQDFSDFTGAMTGMADDTASKVGESFAEKIQGTIKDIAVYVDKNFGPSFRRAVKKIVPQIDKLGDTFGRVWDDISTLGTPLKNWFTDEYTTYLQTYIDTAGDIVSGLLDSFNMVFSDIWDVVLFPFLQTFTTTILPTLTEFGTEVLLTLGTLFGEIKTLFDLLWTEGIKPGLDLIVGIWQGVWESISQAWNKWGKPVFDNIRLAIKNTGDTLENIWNTILKPVWDKIMEVVDRLWTQHLKPLVDNFLDFVGELVNGALEIYNKFILPIVNWLVRTFGPAFTEVFGAIADIVGTVFGVISDVISGIITVLKGIVQFITGIFTGNWEKAWTGIKNIFKGIWDAIWGIVKGVINLIIDGLNMLWKGIYYAVKGIVDMIGGISGAIGKLLGQDWSFSMPEKPPLIPRLAAGGVIEQPTLAMVGEYAGARSNPEIVTPENKMREIFGEGNNAVVVALYEVAQMIIEAIRDTSGGDDMSLEDFVRRLYPAIEREKSRRGTVSFAKT